MKCQHDGATLKKVYAETTVFECPKCKCIWRLVIVRMTPECAAKRQKDLELVLAARKQKRGKKRGRRKRKTSRKRN